MDFGNGEQEVMFPWIFIHEDEGLKVLFFGFALSIDYNKMLNCASGAKRNHIHRFHVTFLS